ncbi:MAG: Kelch repeat-containing protein [Planctomycetota bacterium]
MTKLSVSVRVVAAAALALPAPAQNAWTQVTTTNAPSRGLWPGMAFATVTGKCYLYGGAGGGTTSNETWEYDGSDWTLVPTVGDPGERHTFGICYDEVRNVIVMFGGSSNAYVPSGETWEFDPVTSTWTDVTPLSAPSPQARWGCKLAYDLSRNVTVLYGGWSGGGFTNDTWEWDGVSWTQVTTSNIPSPRDRFGMCYDLARSRVVLFGGISAQVSDETWEYDGVDWTLVPTLTTPPARQKNYLAYDVQRGVSIMQGGQANAVQLLDSWEYDGFNWRLVPSTPSPARGENATCYDLLRGRVVVFGGYSFNGVNTDTWEFGPATTPRFHVYGAGCAGGAGVPTLQATSGVAPALGAGFGVTVGSCPPSGGVGFLALGDSNYQFNALPLPFDLAALGWSGCSLYVAPTSTLPYVHAGGAASVPLPVPNNAALAGYAFHVQAANLDAAAPNGEIAFSAAAEVIVN